MIDSAGNPFLREGGPQLRERDQKSETSFFPSPSSLLFPPHHPQAVRDSLNYRKTWNSSSFALRLPWLTLLIPFLHLSHTVCERSSARFVTTGQRRIEQPIKRCGIGRSHGSVCMILLPSLWSCLRKPRGWCRGYSMASVSRAGDGGLLSVIHDRFIPVVRVKSRLTSMIGKLAFKPKMSTVIVAILPHE